MDVLVSYSTSGNLNRFEKEENFMQFKCLSVKKNNNKKLVNLGKGHSEGQGHVFVC